MAWVLTIVLVLTCTNLGQVNVKAADYVAEEGDLKLYFELSEGETAADWGFSVWGGAKIKDSGESFTPTGWGSPLYELKEDTSKEGWAYVIINGNVEGCQFAKKADPTKPYQPWNPQIATDNLKEAYYSPTEAKWYKESDKTTEIKEVLPDDVYYIVGDKPFTWTLSELTEEHKLKETEQGSKIYTITLNGLSVGQHKYKIVQDPDQFAWKYAYLSEDTVDNGANSVFTTTKATDTVTITLDKTGDEPAVTAVVTPGEDVEYTYQEGDLKLYFELPEDTEVSDWGFSAWQTSAFTIRDSGESFTPTGWGSSLAGLKADEGKEGWAYVIINISGSLEGCQFADKTGKTLYQCWNSAIATLGVKEAYYDPAVKKWYKESNKTNEIAEPTLDDIYYVVGGEPFTWNLEDLTDEHLMKETAEDSKIYTLTKTGLTVGEHMYKIVQDPADFGWKYEYLSDKKTTDGKNSVFTIGDTTDTVTITLDNTGETPVVTAVVTAETQKYQVSVNGGSCGDVTEYKAGDSVSVTANAPETGKVFDKWTCDDAGVVFADASKAATTFTMPSKAVTVTATYKTATYTVTFKDGDTVLDTQTVEYGKPASAPEVTAKEGYTLSWDKAFTEIKEDTTVNAVWTIKKYTVIFKDGDTVIDTQTVEHGKSASAPENIEKEGYVLTWDKAYTNIKEDTTINAVWTERGDNQFIVKFVSDGQVIETQLINSGEAAREPDITKEGYTLSWDKEFSSITEDVIITAVWTINKYTVTFKDGDTVLGTQTVEYGGDAKAPEVTAKEGYTLSWDKAFIGIKEDTTVNAVWTVNKYTVTFKDGDTVLDTQTVEHGKDAKAPEAAAKEGYTLSWDKAFVGIKEDTTVNAVWTINKYTVTFKDGDTVLDTQTVECGKDAKAPEITAKEGYTLSWDKAFAGIKEDTTVNAVWTINKYTVTFKDGDTVLDTQTVEYGKDAKAPEVAAKEGYTLSWDKAFTGIKEDTTVNAVWTATAQKYTVTFKDGSKVLETQSVESGKAATAPEAIKKTGYTLSWDKKFDNITADTTINAVWTANKYTVKFNKNGGTVSKKSKTVKYASKYGSLPTAKRKGYTFSGWYTSKTGGKKVTSSVKVSTAKTHTLYARWTKVKVAKVSIKSIKAAKKKMTVTFKKVSGAKGYEIVYATNSKFKSAKKITTKSVKTTVTKLNSKSTIYVKVRAYKIDSTGKKVYGSYSSVKKVKIK